MRALSLICLLTCGLATTLLAQQSAQSTPRPVPPPGPLLEKAPDFAQWTITNRSSKKPIAPRESDNASPSPSPTPSPAGTPQPDALDYQTLVVKTKPTRYELTAMPGGRKVAKWFLPDLQIVAEGDGNPVVSFAGGKLPTAYAKTDFPGFEWVSPQTYEGIQKVAGQDCLIFREFVKADAQAAAKSDPQLASLACISLDSRLPVALQVGDQLRTYAFRQAPDAPLTLPPAIGALVEQWRSTMQQAARPVARP